MGPNKIYFFLAFDGDDDDGRYKQPEEDGPCWRLEGGALLKLDSQGPSFVGTTPGHDHVDGGGDNVDQWILRLHIVLFSLYIFLFCPL